MGDPLWHDLRNKDIKRILANELSSACLTLLQTAVTKLNLSGRAYNPAIKVARTIADLAESEMLQPEHLAEHYNTELKSECLFDKTPLPLLRLILLLCENSVLLSPITPPAYHRTQFVFPPLLGSPPKTQVEDTSLKEKNQKLIKEQKREPSTLCHLKISKLATTLASIRK